MAILSAFLEALFPARCGGCGETGSGFCLACRPPGAELVVVPIASLPIVALGRYAGPLRRAVLACKHGRRDVGDALAALASDRCGALDPRIVFVPVPTTRRRRGERGFDPGVRFATLLGERLDRPVLDVLRQRAGDAQRGRSRAARLRAHGRFACAAPRILPGALVVLVDDVVTTGSTLRDCAAALEAHGAHVCAAIVLAFA